MVSKDLLINEIETLPIDCLEQVMDFVIFVKMQKFRKISETMLISEQILAKDWETKEEDEAWSNL